MLLLRAFNIHTYTQTPKLIPNADGDGIRALIQAAMVQLHAAVVQVHAVDQLVVLLVILGARGSTLTLKHRTLDLNNIIHTMECQGSAICLCPATAGTERQRQTLSGVRGSAVRAARLGTTHGPQLLPSALLRVAGASAILAGDWKQEMHVLSWLY